MHRPRSSTLRLALAVTVGFGLPGTAVLAQEEPSAPAATEPPTSAPANSSTTEPESTTSTSTTATTSTATTSTTTAMSTTTTGTAVAPAHREPRCAPATTTTTTTTVPESTTTTTSTTLPPCPTTTVPSPPTTAPPTAPPPPPPPPAAPLGLEIPAELEAILFTIRLVESGHRYEVPPNRGNASGAYQYIASTWNNHAGYPHAHLAPPEIQDARAADDVRAILDAWKGDVSMVPVIWYYPRAAREPALMDQVPVPQAGNRLTVREYQHRWLDVLAYVTGNPVTYRSSAVPPNLEFLSGRPPELSVSLAELLDVAFPVLGAAVVAPPVPCATDGCEPGAAAIVYGQKLQPIVAAASGVVTAVEQDLVTGAHTVTITDALGRTYVYAGFNDDNPDTDDGDAPGSLRLTSLGRVGTTVRTGQIIGFMGDTDPMPTDEQRGTGGGQVWPHLRLTIRDADGVRLDADLLVSAAQQRQACHVAIGPWSVPEEPDVDRDEVDVDALLNGGWTLHADGTVTAHGRSALILPPQGCVWAPQEAYGPGAAGADVDADWDAPIELPAKHWVTGVGGGSVGRGLTLVP